MVGASGSAQTPKVTTTKLSFNASTGALTATSIQNTPIGSTTPNTGAFTTLQTNTVLKIRSTGDLDTTGYAAVSLEDNSTGSWTERGNIGFGTSDGNFSVYNAVSGKSVIIGAGGTNNVAAISSTGLAVTGTLSASGNITATNGTLIVGTGAASTNGYLELNGASTSSYGAMIRFNRNSVIKWQMGHESGINGGASDAFILYDQGVGIALKYTTSTGLAVTGAVSASKFSMPSSASTSGDANAIFYNAASDGYGLYTRGGGSGGRYSLMVQNYAGGTDMFHDGSALYVSGQIRSSSYLMAGISPSASYSDGRIYCFDSSGNLKVFFDAVDGESLLRRNSNGTVLTFTQSGTTVGTISVTTTATAYNTSSDARLKTNVRDYDGYDSGAVIDRILPRIFDWKTGEKDSIGFIAQELYAVYPQAVSKGDDGEEITKQWGVDFSKLVPVLVAELKALRARVAALESRQ